MEPWKLSKSDRARFKEVVSATCHSLKAIAILLWPIMPKKMEELLCSIGVKLDVGKDYFSELKTLVWSENFKLKKIDPLFKKYELKKEAESKNEKAKTEIENQKIKFDDFIKVEIRAGEIKEIEDIPESKKIYKMTVDFGEYGTRTICAGLKEFYKPQDLKNKKSIFAFNLVPRKLLGVQSEGMMMMAKNSEGIPTIVSVEKGVLNGTRLN